MTVNVVNHKDFLIAINELLLDSGTVLDVGCGVGATITEFCCPIKIGVDAHRPYLENAKLGEQFIKLNFRAERLNEIFLPNSMDSSPCFLYNRDYRHYQWLRPLCHRPLLLKGA